MMTAEVPSRQGCLNAYFNRPSSPPGARSRVDLAGRLCAASEYARIALGEKDFVLYWRLLPWDHLAGGLIASEAGGAARHVDGSSCTVADGLPGSLVTHDATRWDDIRRAVVG